MKKIREHEQKLVKSFLQNLRDKGRVENKKIEII